MRNIIIASIMAICGVSCQTTPPASTSSKGLFDDITAPQSLTFRGETYRAGHSAADQMKALVEYYRKGENPKSWQKMLALRLDSTGKDSLRHVTAIEQVIKTGGNRAVRVYQSTNGHGVEFILTARGQQELNVFRYVDWTNGLVSLQYAEIIPFTQLDRIEKTKMKNFYVTLRSNAVWSLEAMNIPHINMKTLPEAAGR